MGLRDRLRKLQKAAEADTVVLVCPECAEEYRVPEDASLDYLVLEWLEGTGNTIQRPIAPEVVSLSAHEHDPSSFVNKADGSPWLGHFFHGIARMPRPEEVEDLSEP